MDKEPTNTPFESAAELFLRIRNEDDPLRSPLLEEVPEDIADRVKLMLEGMQMTEEGTLMNPAAPEGRSALLGPLVVILALALVAALGFWFANKPAPSPGTSPAAGPGALGAAAEPVMAEDPEPAETSWLSVLRARELGQEPDAEALAEIKELLGEELWAQVEELTADAEENDAFRSDGGEALISPRNVITQQLPTFRFAGLGEDPGAMDYRVVIIRLDDLEEVGALTVFGSSADTDGILSATLPEDAALAAGAGEPMEYMWSVEPVGGAGHDDLSAVFSVTTPSYAEELLATVTPSGEENCDHVRRALLLEKNELIDLALAELEGISEDAEVAELALRDRLRNRLRRAANLPAIDGSATDPLAMDSLLALGEGEEPKQVLKLLKKTAKAELETATEIFSSRTRSEVDDDYSKVLHVEARRHLDAALVAFDRIYEEFPDEEKSTEKLLEDAYALSFWLDRFAVIDDFDYAAEMKKIKDPGGAQGGDRAGADVGEPSAIVLPRNESFDAAMEKAEKADAKGETAEAFYEYLDAVENHAAADLGGVQRARERLMGIRDDLTSSGVLSYLKRELKSGEVARRTFAAQEMGALRSFQTAQPLRKALLDEEDEGVRSAILRSFRTTQKRASGKELAYLKKSKDVELKLAVLDTLAIGVRGRYGALAAVEFVNDKSGNVSDRALQALKEIGGRDGAYCLGKVASDRKSSTGRVSRVFAMLVELDTPEAAAVLIPQCTSKGKHRLAAEDALVQMGKPAILPCIEALRSRKVAKHVHDVLKRMTGQTMGQDRGKWLDWHRGWLRNGGIALPRFARGAEPWMGGNR